MRLISNHLLTLPEFKKISKDMVIRINLAHVKDEKELNRYLSIPNDIFLDFPKGRKKPPTPKIKMKKAMEVILKHKNIKYFAVSNIEVPKEVRRIKSALPERTKFVPKIETMKGVLNLEYIFDCGIEYIMLDAEDLYTNANGKTAYLKAVKKVRETCKEYNVKLLELYGVVFNETIL